MKFLKAITLTVLTLLLIFSECKAEAHGYFDIDDSFAKTSIEKWSDRGVLNGNEGYFRTTDKLTRGELAVVLNRILRLKNTQAAVSDFIDLKDSFYTDAMLSLYDNKIIFGFDGNLRAEDFITREETAVMFMRAFGLTPVQGETDFVDSSTISDWAKSSMVFMARNKYIQGFENKIFPRAHITRAELAKLLDNMIRVYINTSDVFDGTHISEMSSGIVVVSSEYASINNVALIDTLIVSGNNRALSLGNSTINTMIVMGKSNKTLKLINSRILNLNADCELEVEADKDSKVPENITNNISVKPLQPTNDAKNPLKDNTGAGLTDEYSPIFPKDRIYDKPSVPKSGIDKNLWVILDGINDKGIIYLSADEAKTFTLPEAAFIANKLNGECTPDKIKLDWRASYYERLQTGARGKYIFYAVAKEDVLINEANYKMPSIAVVIIVK